MIVILLNFVMQKFTLLSVALLSVILLKAILLSVNLLEVATLSVILPNGVPPLQILKMISNIGMKMPRVVLKCLFISI